MSESSGVGTAAVVIGGIGAVYWLAMATLAFAAVTTVGLVVGAGFAIYALWGIGLYLIAAVRAFSSGDLDYVSALIVAPLFAPVGFTIASFFTGVLGVPAYAEWLEKFSQASESDSLTLVSGVLGLTAAVIWTFAVMPFIFLGWFIAGWKGYRSSSWEPAVWYWSFWGITLGFSLDPSLWQQLLRLVF